MSRNIKGKARRVKDRSQEAQDALEAHLEAAKGLREMGKRLEGEVVLLEAAATAWEKRAGVLSQLIEELNAARGRAHQP